MPDLSWAFGLECTNFVSPPLQFPNRALFFGENPNLIFDRMMNRLHLFSFKRMVRVENMFQASYDTFHVNIFFSFLSFLIDIEVIGKASVVNVLSI